MSEYPIQFTDGTWAMKHAMDDDWDTPDFEEAWENGVIEKLEELDRLNERFEE